MNASKTIDSIIEPFLPITDTDSLLTSDEKYDAIYYGMQVALQSHVDRWYTPLKNRRVAALKTEVAARRRAIADRK